MASNDLAKHDRITESIIKCTSNKKNKLKGCASTEIIDQYLHEILHINNLQMDLAMQTISNDKTVRSNTKKIIGI